MQNSPIISNLSSVASEDMVGVSHPMIACSLPSTSDGTMNRKHRPKVTSVLGESNKFSSCWMTSDVYLREHRSTRKRSEPNDNLLDIAMHVENGGYFQYRMRRTLIVLIEFEEFPKEILHEFWRLILFKPKPLFRIGENHQ
jgi:hypothetical protein